MSHHTNNNDNNFMGKPETYIFFFNRKKLINETNKIL